MLKKKLQSEHNKQKSPKLKMNKNKQQPKFDLLYSLKCGIASFTSTCISGTLLHPLELIKVRLQSHDGQANQENIVPKYRGILNGFRQIIADEGYMGLYKGLSITVTSSAIAASLFFTIYEKRKKALTAGKDLDKQHQMYEILRAGIESGIALTFMTQPMWVIKTRMLLNTRKNINEGSNIVSTVRQIKEQHSFKGFYKGLSMNLLLSFSGAVQMFVYQGSKKLYDRLQIPQSEFMQKNFICGGIAKIGNVLFVYPFTTIRTRIQQNQFVKAHPKDVKYHNVLEIIAKTWRIEGAKGFYKGITANVLRGIPERGIYFYSYEIIKRLILPEYKH